MEIWQKIVSIAVCELAATLIFYLLARWNKMGKTSISFRSLLKGWTERGFLVYALVAGYPQALTLFAALKIATRIKDDQSISNDFYLLGNLVSVCLAIFYSTIISG